MKSTTDLWFVCFLMENSFEVKDYQSQKAGKVRFIFEMTDADWKKMKIAFQKSAVMKIKLNYEKLLNLIY
jgi:hypothetical protein